MRKLLWMSALTLVVFAGGFMMGVNWKSAGSDEVPVVVTENAAVSVDPVETGMTMEILSAEIIAKAHRDLEDGKTYSLTLALPDTEVLFQLELSYIEYKLVKVGDSVDVVRRVNDGVAESLDWWRSPEGKLNLGLTGPIVLVDPGHGGIDQGQGGNDLWVEKTMNLTMSKRMAANLERAGIQVVMTRGFDAYVSLYDRVAMAEYVEADMIISNHVNRMDGKASGVEVLYGSYSDVTFAKSLGEAISTEDHPVYRVYRRRSVDIPGLDYYFLHKYTEIPSYIIEYGFADNERDTLYLQAHWEEMVDRASEAVIGQLAE